MSLLISCKSCNHKVALDARLCPKCGIKEPGPENEILLKIIAVYVLIGIFIFLRNKTEWFGGETPPALWIWLFHITWTFSTIWMFVKVLKKYI